VVRYYRRVAALADHVEVENVKEQYVVTVTFDETKISAQDHEKKGVESGQTRLKEKWSVSRDLGNIHPRTPSGRQCGSCFSQWLPRLIY
jgi:hypothetical protein